jgi:hypothetical protein
MGFNSKKLLGTLLLALAPLASATTWYVNGVSGSDSNDCISASTACKTIGHAISLAASGDTIKVAAATYPEILTVGINLKIRGGAAKTAIIDGGGSPFSVVYISSPARVTISNMTITDGGTGIWNSGTLTVTDSTISGNITRVICRRNTSCRLIRAGIANDVGATLTITNSTISQNSTTLTGCSPGYCRGVKGGGIYNVGALILNNSTVSGNTIFGPGGTQGGGIYSVGGSTTISNSTIAGNSPRGIFAPGASLQNSIIANNAGGNCLGGISLGYNLSSDNTCGFTNTGDLISVDPMLGPLQYNGGPTQTMALPYGSPAIDAGNPNGCTDNLGHLLKTDQRGAPRPDKEDSGGCDMGAYESQSD